jgi:plasmid stabilization system protein ParE
MPRYVLSPQARDDLSELRDYIAQDDAAAARRVLNEVREAMRRLAQMPELGHVREDLADETLRFWPVRSYLIICRPEVEPIQIVRVLSGYRDIAQLLS